MSRDPDNTSTTPLRYTLPPTQTSQRHSSSRGMSFFSSIASTISTLRRSTHTRQESPPPAPEDLGLKTLRQVYSTYSQIDNPIEKERQFYKILPLFCKNCSKYSGDELISKFPEAFDFAEYVSALLVRNVTQRVNNTNPARASMALLKYFESSEDMDTGSFSGTGLTILKAIHILANGTELLVDSMSFCNLCSVLVRCLHLFMDLPPPSDARSRYSGSSMSQTATPSSLSDQDLPISETAERNALEKLLRPVLTRLLHNMPAVDDLVRGGDISLLFGVISSPCPQYNKMWRKVAADCLTTICKHSLSDEVINFIHTNGCILFCLRNIDKCLYTQPPLEVVQMFSTLFCCLKDSADFSQALFDDFSNSRGYKILHDYLLQLDKMDVEETRPAIKNLVLLIQDMVFSGFLNLEPTINDGGPFQGQDFRVPVPIGDGSSVKNNNMFQVLQDAFLRSQSSYLGNDILDTLLCIFKTDPANYFILQDNHCLSQFLEHLTDRNADVQVHIFILLEYILMELNYVPTAELTSLSLLLTLDSHPKTMSLALNFLLKLISHDTKFRLIFREVGILIMLVNALKIYAKKLRGSEEGMEPSTPSSISSPSLPLGDLEGAEEEYVFLLMECIRATIEGSVDNGQMFRDQGGSKCVLGMINHNKPRRMALRLLTQLILLDDGAIDMNALLDQLNQSAQTAVIVKSEILQTVLGVFQLDSMKKCVFREVCGFQYLISVLASLIGSLGPLRYDPWTDVARSDILHLVRLVFTVLTSAMQDDLANRSFFEQNIRFESFTVPLLLLGCFDQSSTAFSATPTHNSHDDNELPHVGSFTSFEAEFKTWKRPNECLNKNSFVYCSAEVFRFLRDMSLDIPVTQSTSLLEVANLERKRDNNFYRKPAVGGTNSTHLVHPGAVICMIDLLPAVKVPSSENQHNEISLNLMELSGKLTKGKEVGIVKDVVVEVGKEEGKTVPCSPSVVHHAGDVAGNSREMKLNLSPPDVNQHGDAVKGQSTESEDVCVMSESDARNWCVFLQERVVSEIFSIAITERNQQVLCQVGLPQRIMEKCDAVLANEEHPLHQALERTFEKLSYQALMPTDFRNFLRLGNPLCCYLNDITQHEILNWDKKKVNESQPPSGGSGLDEATPTSKGPVDTQKASGEQHCGGVTPADDPEDAPYGGSLSLARIQSLVSMTTPRDGIQPGVMGHTPPFVEFDLSIDGFGCLFLPSVFPQSIDQGQSANQTPPTINSVSGVGGGGERTFPPNSGFTFTTWIQIIKCLPEEPQIIGLITLTQTFFTKDKKLVHCPCLRVYLKPSTQSLVVTTQLPQNRRDSALEQVVNQEVTEKVQETVFHCPGLFSLQSWHHVALVINKDSVMKDKVLRGKPKVTLFVNGQLQGTKKMAYIFPIHLSSQSNFLQFPSETTPYLINAHIGTHVIHRHVSQLIYRLGPTFLLEEQVEFPRTVVCMYKLGPAYCGSFQAPMVRDQLFTPIPSLLHSEVIGSLVSEEKVLFGLLPCRPIVRTAHELEKIYNHVDILTIARELSLPDNDDVTPVPLLNNTSAHLYGPSRTLGAIICGYSGIRSFEPQPLRSLLSAVGGTSVVLGLVAMATTVDSLYASMKALVCIIGNNTIALKEMERTGGFQILGMLLRSKGKLINSNILHLTYTLVGTVNSEHESACIPNPIAFRDLLSDLSVWSVTSEEIQRSLFGHFFDLLTHSSNRPANAQQMLAMKMVSELLFLLLDERLTVKTIKMICNIISSLMASDPGQEDIRRVGQLLATTLPSNRLSDENTIYLYRDTDSAHLEVPMSAHARFGRFHGNEGKQRRAIVLRNILLEVIISLLSDESMDLNSKFAQQLFSALGFDWLMLFLDKTIHTETVIRALRILVHLLHEPSLETKFHEGDIFGSWVIGFETISTEMTHLLSQSLLYFNPLRQSVHLPQIPVPGAIVLAQLLPHHANLPQVYLLMLAYLQGRSCVDIPYSAQFNVETLEELFEIGSGDVKTKKKRKKKSKMSGDAAYVLLAVCRALLYQSSDPSKHSYAVDLIKFFDRLYRQSPDFRLLAVTQEFIDALASTLFPPISFSDIGKSTNESEGDEVDRDSEWIMIDTELLPGAVSGSHGRREPILTQMDNLAVCTVVKLLRTIAVDGFSSTVLPTKDNTAICPVFERVLSAAPDGFTSDLQKTYQTLILQNVMEYLQIGNEDIMITFKGSIFSGSIENALMGLSVFCARLVDKVWQKYFVHPPSSVYGFLISIVEQARRFPKSLPLSELQRSLNRIILFQVNSIPGTETEQKALMDTLCLFSSQAHIIFDDTNNDIEFLECLTYCLLKIAFTGQGTSKHNTDGASASSDHTHNLPSGYVPGSIAMMKSGANRVWTKMLEYKRKELEQILLVELPTPKANVARGDPLSASMSLGATNFSRIQNCQQFISNNLMKAWENFVSREHSTLTSETAQRDMRRGPRMSVKSMTLKTKKKKGLGVNSEQVVHEYLEVLCPLLVLAAQKYFETLLRKHQRNIDYRYRIAVSEWKKIEYELTRERGLWGPEKPSPLDKWMLDTVEGPCRMRKRLRKDHLFYQHYPHKPKTTIPTKYKQPISLDSELFYKRSKLFQKPALLATPTQTVIGFRDEDSTIEQSLKRDSETPSSPTPSPMHVPTSGPSRQDIFNHPDSDNPVAQTLYKMIEPDDRITFQYQCSRLTGLDSMDGVLLLGTTHIYVIEGVTISGHGDIMDLETAPEGSYHPVVPVHLQAMAMNSNSSERGIPIDCIKWSYNMIREVHKRRYLLRHCAFEVFSSDGQNHFLIFHPTERNKIYQKLLSLAKSSLTDKKFVAGQHSEADPEQTTGFISFIFGVEKSLPDKWANGEISNFQYLMHLNTLAGRSYNDLMQYPIFPWVLADYNRETPDLNDPQTFRDFSKPMGAQSQSRLNRFVERYKYFEDPTGENTPAYYYGTHYSSAMIVASFLIRMEPFTQHFLKLQGGHFDLPDRLFHSIPDAWRSASDTNMADIKELIPEFFYLPEFMVNSNQFDLGTKQSGIQLNDVILPPWAKGDPHEFIRVHREALESDYVSAHLHEWIDLIFGYKQKGEEALKAHNVFHHLFYEGAVDVDKIEDPVKKNAALSFIHNFGQMPKQVFKKPHRPRKVVSSVASESSPNLSAVSNDPRRLFYKNLVQLMPSRDPIKELRGEVSQIVCVSDNKIPVAVDKHKLLLPPNYTHYFLWGFPDFSARTATVEGDRVTGVFEGLHQGRILCSSAADENMILTGGESTVVCVWELKNAKHKEKLPVQLHLKHTLHGHTAPVTCLATSMNYNLVVSGSKDQTCILWDINSFSFIRQLSNHSSGVTIVTINQLSGNIVSCAKNQIRLWTVNGTLLAESSLTNFSNFRFTCCVVSELYEWDKDNVIVTGSTDGVVRIWVLEYEPVQSSANNKRRSKTMEQIHKLESDLDFPKQRGRASSVISKLRDTTVRSRSSTSPTPVDKLESNLQGLGLPEFVDLHFSEKQDANSDKIDKNPTTSIPVMHDRGSYASVEDRLDCDEMDLLLDIQRASHEDEDVDEESLSVEQISTGGVSDGDADRGSRDQHELNDKDKVSPDRGDHSDTNLVEISISHDTVGQSHDTGAQSHDIGVTNNVTDVVFSDYTELVDTNEGQPGKATLDSPDNDTVISKDKSKATLAVKKPAKVNLTYNEMMAEEMRKSEDMKRRTGVWSRKLTMLHTFTMHTSLLRKDNDTPASVSSLCISKDNRRLYVGDTRGRIFSWSVSDNSGSVMEHWLRDEAVDNCMRCGIEFRLLERKHHCRDCGRIFCAKCSPFENDVKRLRILKKVRVCIECYENSA